MEVISKAALLRVYRRYAPIYNLAFGRALEAGRRALADALAVHSPTRVLEVGVGTGLALPYYPTQAQVCGLDLSPEMLRHARRLAQRRGLSQVRLLCADAEQLPFASSSFDCVTLPYVLSVTPNPDTLMAELRRVCRPGGHIFILNHFSGAGGWRWSERLLAPLAQKVGFRSQLSIECLTHAGWTVKAIRSVNLLGLSKLVVIRNAAE